MPTQILGTRGNYQDWNVYKKSVIICDVTEYFITTYLERGDRTIDQMRQAARSGKQNIVEGSAAAAISRETEIKLTGVAKASLQELAEDYRDYLRRHNYEIWPKDDSRTVQARAYCKDHMETAEFLEKCKARTPETICNIMLVQIFQLDYMLFMVLKRSERLFIEEGGIRERMGAVRRQWRKDNLGY